ncbi:MAG: SDR family oxidoreductase [Armatimonadetes bacterium]|nr:SDR family oxidoreductase [Armatimonadota bacterium]
MADTSQKIALITGANKGIGKETARQLGQLGYTVLVGSRDLARGESAVAELRGEGIDAHALALDVTNLSSVQFARAEVESKFGHLDALINNAGISIEPFGGADSTLDTQTYRNTFEANVFGLIDVTREFLPLLEKAPAARIVNLSSILSSLALHADPGSPIYDFKAPAYDASKTTVNAFTVHLAYSLRNTPIKVNAAHPGWVKTDMGGEGAPMEIVDGAKTSVALATLPADGPSGGLFHMGETLPW